VDDTKAGHPLEQSRAAIEVLDPLAHRHHGVDPTQEPLLEPRIEPAVEKAELDPEAAPRSLRIQMEVLFRALAPELPHPAVGRHPIPVMQAHRRRVDDAAVADGDDHR
jgi:hypothetical protein